MESMNDYQPREIVVIPIIDTSGSMYGTRIVAVNEAMREMVEQLAQFNKYTLNSKLLIAPMEFSSGARWFALQNNQPAEVESFRWIDMQAAGLTDMGAAFKLLNDKLTTEENGGWMKSRGGAAPVLILISDGGPTDKYREELQKLKKKGWFRHAIKFAVAIEGADKSVLEEFTCSPETVISVIDTGEISKVLDLILGAVFRGYLFVGDVTDEGTPIDTLAQSDWEIPSEVYEAILGDFLGIDDIF